jgi:hypothetical protein
MYPTIPRKDTLHLARLNSIFPPPPPTTVHLDPHRSHFQCWGSARNPHPQDAVTWLVLFRVREKCSGHLSRTKYKSTTIACSMDFNSRPSVPWSLSSRSFVRTSVPWRKRSRTHPDARVCDPDSQVRELTAPPTLRRTLPLFRPFKPTQGPLVERHHGSCP